MKASRSTSPHTKAILTSACASVLFLLAAVGSSIAAGATLNVATNGIDSSSCGPEGLPPCRSISRAIAHASPGDTIVVGPGVYGDINRDALVDPTGDSGEEARVMIPQLSCPFVGLNVVWALIRVDKPLTIVSRDGAGSTVIDAGGQFSENYAAVDIASDGVVFGKRGKGFTVRNSTIGVNVNSGVVDAAVQGNVAECLLGFLAGSCDGMSAPAVGTVFKGNTSAPDAVVGFQVYDSSATVSGNLSKGALYAGFALMGGSAAVSKNIAVDGFGRGFLALAGATLNLSGNAAIGNLDAGIQLVSPGTAAVDVTIEKNSLFGNGKRPQYPPVNCGLVLQNSGAEPMTVHANGNWWGAATGPSADPADFAGGTCSAGVVTLDLTEWAGKEIRVKAPTK